MNRRSFFRTLGAATGAIVLPPQKTYSFLWDNPLARDPIEVGYAMTLEGNVWLAEARILIQQGYAFAQMAAYHRELKGL